MVFLSHSFPRPPRYWQGKDSARLGAHVLARSTRGPVHFFEGAITDMNMLKEREMLLAEFFEDIVPEEYYATALKKLLDFYGDEVLQGIDLGFGFDETPGIAGPTGDSRSSSFAHDQKTEENKTVAHIAEDNQETGSHTYSEKMEERLDEL